LIPPSTEELHNTTQYRQLLFMK